MLRLGRLGSLVLVIAVLSVSACGGSEEREAKYLERAREHLASEDYDKAKVDTRNVLKINHKNVEARYMLAQIAEKQENWRDMIGALNSTLEADPGHVEANIKLAQVLAGGNQLDKAEEHVNTVLQTYPINADALGTKALIEFRRGNKEQAQKLANQALAQDPAQTVALSTLGSLIGSAHPEELLALVDKGLAKDPTNLTLIKLRMAALEGMGRSDDVIAQLKQLVEQYPDDIEYARQLAAYYVNKFQASEAEAFLRERLAANPDDVRFKLLLVGYLQQIDGSEKAQAELHKMVDASPDTPELRFKLGELLVASGDLDQAEAVYKSTFDHGSEGTAYQTARVRLAQLALLQRDAAKAQGWVDQALEIEAANPDALLLQARIKFTEGKFEEAIPDLRMILRSNPEAVSALLMIAEAQRRTGSLDLALDNYRQVLGLAPDNAIALYQSATLMAARQEYDKAAANLEKLLASQPENVQAINELSGIYSKLQRWDEAQALITRLEGKPETQPVADLLSAGLAQRQGEAEKALHLAQSALEADAQLTGALTIIAESYYKLQKVDAGTKWFQGYLDEHPDSNGAKLLLAGLYMADDEKDLAAQTYKDVIARSPENIAAYINLSRLYLANGETDKVIALYEQGLKANPDNPTLAAGLANEYINAARYDDALALLDKAYAKNADAVVVGNNLAALLIDHFPTSENLQRAREITRGYETSSSPAQLDTAGWLQYHLDNIPQAISLLKAAQEAGGEGPEYWYHLGLAYSKNGQKDLAKEQLGKALEGEQQYAWRDAAQAAYDSL